MRVCAGMPGWWRRAGVLVVVLGGFAVGSAGTVAQVPGTGTASPQTSPPASATQGAGGRQGDGAERPLPDTPALMREVERHQVAEEALEKDYIYRSVEVAQETDGHGGVKKTMRREMEVFYVNGVMVRRTLSKDGKPLSADEMKKENERIDKDAAKARERRDKADAEGKETDPRGHDVVTVARILELGTFSNPRRVQINGRDTIAVDYAGDPKAKTRNRMEDVIRDMVGTVWVDEEDKMLVQTEGRFLNAFKIGGGLLVNIGKGTSFRFEQKRVNGEVWLPSRFDAQGTARAMLFFNFNGRLLVENSDYRKFKATSTILPGVGKVEDVP